MVHQSIWNEVCAQLRSMFRNVVAGPFDADLDIGPLISQAQCNRVLAFCEQAELDGIPMIGEGTIAPDVSEGGFYVTARAYGPVPRKHALARDEVLGPVLAAIPFRDEDDAITLANDTPFGLVTGIWTQDISRAVRVAKAVRSGQVFVNTYRTEGNVELPFGGVKQSGHGREKGFEALQEFSVVKTLVIHHG